MADAEVGDDVYGEDPTVRRLESLAAGLLGKEAALYVPSGTMANQLALRLLGRARHRGALRRAGARVPLRARGGGGQRRRAAPAAARRRRALLDPTDVRGALAAQPHHLPEISAVRVREHPHAGERAAVARRPSSTRSSQVARDAGIAVHCDGARIWNAAIALGDGAERCSPPATDTVMFCLSKGLGAPVGSLLCGARDADRRGARATGRASAAACARPG